LSVHSLFDDEVLMKKERADGMVEEVQMEVEMENGGCFATLEASKDQVNLDAYGHTKQTQKNM
jgi:hypothetical protein